ncbi:HEAT repeat domain-containing protein [Fredinandcohnia sp. 179-A 10B2 NHS]|uniref:HEAT repeat domain-containing protein n=1 Tax=Fredinandcohnia sp. 179-A 10B2 NHS TaxID=3235176 RepID=UPI0039A162B8
MKLITGLSSQLGEKTEEGNRRVANACITNPELLQEIADSLSSENAALVGDCAEVLTKVAEVKPKIVLPFAGRLLPLLSHKTTRVRWEAMHALALLAFHIPVKIHSLLPKLVELIETDKSTIVRDYAIEALCFYPLLKGSLSVWEGKHRARVLKGMLYVCQSTSKFTLEIRGIAEEYIEDHRGTVKKAARALVKAIDKGIVR